MKINRFKHKIQQIGDNYYKVGKVQSQTDYFRFVISKNTVYSGESVDIEIKNNSETADNTSIYYHIGTTNYLNSSSVGDVAIWKKFDGQIKLTAGTEYDTYVYMLGHVDVPRVNGKYGNTSCYFSGANFSSDVTNVTPRDMLDEYYNDGGSFFNHSEDVNSLSYQLVENIKWFGDINFSVLGTYVDDFVNVEGSMGSLIYGEDITKWKYFPPYGTARHKNDSMTKTHSGKVTFNNTKMYSASGLKLFHEHLPNLSNSEELYGGRYIKNPSDNVYYTGLFGGSSLMYAPSLSAGLDYSIGSCIENMNCTCLFKNYHRLKNYYVDVNWHVNNSFKSTFDGCTSLKSITIPCEFNNTSNVSRELGFPFHTEPNPDAYYYSNLSQCFNNCSNLRNITFNLIGENRKTLDELAENEASVAAFWESINRNAYDVGKFPGCFLNDKTGINNINGINTVYLKNMKNSYATSVSWSGGLIDFTNTYMIYANQWPSTGQNWFVKDEEVYANNDTQPNISVDDNKITFTIRCDEDPTISHTFIVTKNKSWTQLINNYRNEISTSGTPLSDLGSLSIYSSYGEYKTSAVGFGNQNDSGTSPHLFKEHGYIPETPGQRPQVGEVYFYNTKYQWTNSGGSDGPVVFNS
jgi:hypothetical protein